jgi:ATP-dependent Zn protease
MTPGFTGAEIENLVNTAITEAVHKFKEMADMKDFEYARDRIMMGIERKKLSMSDKDRLNTAIHEAGHAIACYFTPGAKKLYKATIVARGSSLGAVKLPFYLTILRLTWCPTNQTCCPSTRRKYLPTLMLRWEDM